MTNIMKKITPSMQKALVAVHAGGCHGILDRYGKLIVAGERLSFETQTYLRLVSYGLLVGSSGRLSLTSAGVVMSNKLSKPKEKSHKEAEWDEAAKIENTRRISRDDDFYSTAPDYRPKTRFA